MVIVNSPWMCGDVLEHFAGQWEAARPGPINVIARSEATKQSSFANNKKKAGLLRLRSQ
jgi:hypothetical protein